MNVTVCVCGTLSIPLSRRRLTSITGSRRDTWSPLHKVLSMVCCNYFAENMSPVSLLWIITHSKWFVSLCFSPQREDTEWTQDGSTRPVDFLWSLAREKLRQLERCKIRKLLYGGLNKTKHWRRPHQMIPSITVVCENPIKRSRRGLL